MCLLLLLLLLMWRRHRRVGAVPEGWCDGAAGGGGEEKKRKCRKRAGKRNPVENVRPSSGCGFDIHARALARFAIYVHVAFGAVKRVNVNGLGRVRYGRSRSSFWHLTSFWRFASVSKDTRECVTVVAAAVAAEAVAAEAVAATTVAGICTPWARALAYVCENCAFTVYIYIPRAAAAAPATVAPPPSDAAASRIRVALVLTLSFLLVSSPPIHTTPIRFLPFFSRVSPTLSTGSPPYTPIRFPKSSRYPSFVTSVFTYRVDHAPGGPDVRPIDVRLSYRPRTKHTTRAPPINTLDANDVIPTEHVRVLCSDGGRDVRDILYFLFTPTLYKMPVNSPKCPFLFPHSVKVDGIGRGVTLVFVGIRSFPDRQIVVSELQREIVR